MLKGMLSLIAKDSYRTVSLALLVIAKNKMARQSPTIISLRAVEESAAFWIC